MPEMVHPKLPASQRITVGDAQVQGWRRAGWQLAPPAPEPAPVEEDTQSEAPAEAPAEAKPKKPTRKPTPQAPVAGETTPKE